MLSTTIILPRTPGKLSASRSASTQNTAHDTPIAARARAPLQDVATSTSEYHISGTASARKSIGHAEASATTWRRGIALSVATDTPIKIAKAIRIAVKSTLKYSSAIRSRATGRVHMYGILPLSRLSVPAKRVAKTHENHDAPSKIMLNGTAMPDKSPAGCGARRAVVTAIKPERTTASVNQPRRVRAARNST